MLVPPDELERKAAELRAKLADWELGYLVGLVEGEGGLSVYFDKRKERYYPRIDIINTNFNMLFYFRNKLKIGNISCLAAKENCRVCYTWVMFGREALILLRVVFNYLFSCKKGKAALLLGLNKKNEGRYAELIYKQIKKLNNYEENLNLQPKKPSNFSFEVLTQFQLGLIAGLTDGEGAIHITKRGNPQLTISNTCPRLILTLLKILGGCSLGVYRSRRGRKLLYMARVTNRKVGLILEKIKDFLLIKQKQAGLAIEAARISGQRGRHVSPEVRKRKEELYWGIRALNARGRMYSGGPTALTPSIPAPSSSLIWSLPRSLSLLDA